MSASPSREPEAEQGVQSPNDGETSMDPSDPHAAALLGYEFEVKEQDRWLPIANVARIMKLALPENAKIAKEAKECMQECVSEFISFITSEASEKCHQEKRKTVNGEDILYAMTSLGFENYAEALKIYLTKFRETQSARGENPQPHINAQGFGQASMAGPSGVNPATGGSFSAVEGSSNILGGQQAAPGEHDPSGFSALYGTGIPGSHNGPTGGENY